MKSAAQARSEVWLGGAAAQQLSSTHLVSKPHSQAGRKRSLAHTAFPTDHHILRAGAGRQLVKCCRRGVRHCRGCSSEHAAGKPAARPAGAGEPSGRLAAGVAAALEGMPVRGNGFRALRHLQSSMARPDVRCLQAGERAARRLPTTCCTCFTCRASRKAIHCGLCTTAAASMSTGRLLARSPAPHSTLFGNGLYHRLVMIHRSVAIRDQQV